MVSAIGFTILISGRSRPSDKEGGGGGGVSKKKFSALRASVWSNSKGGAGPPGPSPGSATAYPLYGDLSGKY